MASIGVIGSGTWGTALSVLLNGNGHRVQIWSAIPQEIAELKETRIHRNLPEVRLPEAIGLTDDLQEAMRDKDLLVLAVPSVFVRQTSQRMKPYIKQGQVITNVAKGIAEISRLGIDMGGRMETFAGLTGIGDLIVTCASMHSRNRRAGILIGRGYTMEEAMAEVKMVVEGVYSAKAALALSQQYKVSMPIVEQVNAILFGGMPAKEAVLELMLRDKRIENSDLEWSEE